MSPASKNVAAQDGRTIPPNVATGESAFGALFELEPQILRQLLLKAATLVQVGRGGEADALLRDLSSFVSHEPSIPWLLGEVRLERGQAQLALEAFGEALGRDPSAFLVQLIHLGRARALSFLGADELSELELIRVTEGQDPELVHYASVALQSNCGSRT